MAVLITRGNLEPYASLRTIQGSTALRDGRPRVAIQITTGRKKTWADREMA
jgi:hypothetical protein